MAIFHRSTKAQPRMVVHQGDLIPDNRLEMGAVDLLEHDAIARGVAEIAWTAKAPVNIALFGPWGSGKSSVYSMIHQHLARIASTRVKVARYDAWKYGGRELKRNFINSLAQELDLGHMSEFSDGLENDQETPKLRTGEWFKSNWRSLLVGVGLAILVAAIWILTQAAATWLFTDRGFLTATARLIPQAGTVFGLALIATLVGPRVFEGAVQTKRTPAPQEADQFANRFRQLVDAALRGKTRRLVVFIDELDRCDPKDVVATLRDLKTFLDQENCVFIVAADREVIERALRDLPQAKPVREDEPYYATSGAFLDKIFQHQIALPPLRSRALTKFARDLVERQHGVWKELRDQDQKGSDTFDRTVFALIPVHVRSPRRVKVLLNNFATNARIAEARGMDWLDRTHELAVLTVLQTEFPAVAEDMRRVPRLLIYLRGEEEPTNSISDLLAKYIEPSFGDAEPRGEEGEGDITTETAAGRLLSDDKSAAGAKERALANASLRRHLTNYLEKVAAAGIRDPRPDLLYLQAAAGRENLPDPALGDAIDYATDTAPDTVVAAFDGQESGTLAVAIPLLVTQGDGESMPGRGFAYEAACRLIERLDPDDQTATALVAPSLIAAASKNTLTPESMPGALLMACWTGSHDVAARILAQVDESQPPEDLLVRLTSALPHLNRAGSDALLSMLVNYFELYPQPFLTALRDSAGPDAIELWESAEESVTEILNDLETPLPPSSSASSAANPRAAAPAKAQAPESTGEGVALLERIVDAVRSRNEYDRILSRVLRSIQSKRIVAPLRQWVDDNADRLVGTMTDPTLRALHALIALREYPDTDVSTWSDLLPSFDELDGHTAESIHLRGEDLPGAAVAVARDSDIGELAAAVTESADLLLAELITAYATAAGGNLPELNELTRKVAEWSSTAGEDTTACIAKALSDIGWEGGEIADAGGQLLWDRKTSLFATARALAPSGFTDQYSPFADDLGEMLQSITLSSFATEHWCRMARELPKETAADLSDRIEAYEPTDTEAGSVMKMRLVARGAAGSVAPAAAELLELPPGQQSTALTDAWLALRPPAAEASAVVTELVCTAAGLRNYCTSLSVGERTAVWMTLHRAGVKNEVLGAVGAAGIGADALAFVRSEIEKETREPERASHVSRLMCAQAANDTEVKKAASEIAADLLDKGTAGDLRSAADLILWAGGAGYGHKERLRERFNELAERHEKALSKRKVNALVNAGLLTVRKRGLLASFLGH